MSNHFSSSIVDVPGGPRLHTTVVRGRGSGVVLLISGAEEPSTRWPDRLIERLADELALVVMYDHRDVGRSSGMPPGYSINELVQDARAVLAHHEIDHCHVLGRGMGGMIGQLLGLDYPELPRTVTLLSSTAGLDGQAEQPSPWLVERMVERLFGDPPSTAIEQVQAIIEQRIWFAGSRFPVDEHADLDPIAREVAESGYPPEHVPGHGQAVVEAEPREVRLPGLVAPTLIVHGTDDPVYPPSHAIRLHDLVPSSRLEFIEGLGHEVPEAFADQLADLVIAHIKKTESHPSA